MDFLYGPGQIDRILKLPPMEVNGKPLTLTVSAKNRIVINKVLLGEVWLGSGQSNMQMSVMNVANAQEEMAAATYPQIRTFAVKRRGWPQPLEDVEGGWLVSSPEAINRFSAVLYFFGRDLHQQIHHPIGLINSSYGGTIIQSWMRWVRVGVRESFGVYERSILALQPRLESRAVNIRSG